MNFATMQQNNRMSLMMKIIHNIVKEVKMMQVLNLGRKLSNQVIMIIQIHIFLQHQI